MDVMPKEKKRNKTKKNKEHIGEDAENEKRELENLTLKYVCVAK